MPCTKQRIILLSVIIQWRRVVTHTPFLPLCCLYAFSLFMMCIKGWSEVMQESHSPSPPGRDFIISFLSVEQDETETETEPSIHPCTLPLLLPSLTVDLTPQPVVFYFFSSASHRPDLQHFFVEMGKYGFRLSDMMPNAWFYKLKDMSSRSRRNNSSLKKHHPNVAAPSSSYSPRTSSSSTHKSRRKTIYRPSSPTPLWTVPTHVPTHSPYVDNHMDASPEPDYLYQRLQHHHPPSHSSSESDGDGDALASFDCKLTSSTTDIIIDINQDQSTSTSTTPRPILPVPPILTKASFTRPRPRPRPRSRASSTSSSQEQTQKTSPAKMRKPGIKVRGNSPRIQVVQAQARKSMSSVKFSNKNLADSFAVVKSSVDPQRDFWESMVEMIVENDLSASKDLEDLLACYLSLNPPYYHPHIVKAFERIWFHMSNLSL